MRGDIVTIKRVCTPCGPESSEEENRTQLLHLTKILGIPIRGKLATHINGPATNHQAEPITEQTTHQAQSTEDC